MYYGHACHNDSSVKLCIYVHRNFASWLTHINKHLHKNVSRLVDLHNYIKNVH